MKLQTLAEYWFKLLTFISQLSPISSVWLQIKMYSTNKMANFFSKFLSFSLVFGKIFLFFVCLLLIFIQLPTVKLYVFHLNIYLLDFKFFFLKSGRYHFELKKQKPSLHPQLAILILTKSTLSLISGLILVNNAT